MNDAFTEFVFFFLDKKLENVLIRRSKNRWWEFVFIFRKYKAEEQKPSSASYSITSISYKYDSRN